VAHAGVERRQRQPLFKEIPIDVRELGQVLIEVILPLFEGCVEHLE